MTPRIFRTIEFPKFLLFGAAAALTTLATSWVIYGSGFSPVAPYWCATGLGASLGLIVNFLLNYLWNFRFHGRSSSQQFATFLLVSGFGVLLTALVSEVNFRILNFLFTDQQIRLGDVIIRNQFAANLTAVALVALYSYPAHRFISFNVGLGARLLQLRSLIASPGALSSGTRA